MSNDTFNEEWQALIKRQPVRGVNGTIGLKAKSPLA